ncbi:MAG: imidazole glycerol phosphate synthase cyclase subunit, partial [Sulfuricella sp.]|nr:imidazole glycerol phosphate synthase cyclase subunit [Sulfuricella sp.]
MLKKRIIPKLLIKNKVYGKSVRPILVTTRNYDQVFEVGDPVAQAKIYEAQLADELIVLNIGNKPIAEDLPLLCIIEKLASETFMPLAVGGGVSSVEDFALLLERGADKVSINTAAVFDPDLITRAANRFGAQCVVVSIDFRHDITCNRDTVVTNHATQNTHLNVVDWAKRAVDAGAGEILLTDADRDGSGRGLNIAVGKIVADAVDVPVILSGGCGVAQHFVDGFI